MLTSINNIVNYTHDTIIELGYLGLFLLQLFSYAPMLIILIIITCSYLLYEKLSSEGVNTDDKVNVLKAFMIVCIGILLLCVWDVLSEIALVTYMNKTLLADDVLSRFRFIGNPQVLALRGVLHYLFMLMVFSLLLRYFDTGLFTRIYQGVCKPSLKVIIYSLVCYLIVAMCYKIINMLFVSSYSADESGLSLSLSYVYNGLAGESLIFSTVFLIIAVVLIAFCYELLFRGILYNYLRNVFGVFPAVILVALLFATFHPSTNIPFILFALLFSIAITLLYEKVRSIYPVIIVHACFIGTLFVSIP